MWRQLGVGLLRVALAVVVGSIVGGLLFGGIDALRTFQADTIASSVARSALQMGESTDMAPPDALFVISKFIDWYSTVFFGYSRFGAGLFMLAGAFWAMGEAKGYSLPARVIIGFVAGFLMGTRLAMFILSKPILVLAIALLSAIIGAVFLSLAGRPSNYLPLPKLQFKHET